MDHGDSTLTVRRFAPAEWRPYRDLRLRALEDAPDAFGSTYAHESERAETEWRTRLERGSASSRDLPLVAEVNGEPCGLAWVRLDGEMSTVAHLYQMWVAPEYRGQGIGRALLDAAVAWARTVKAVGLMLDVTVGNGPALHLYEQAGFVPAGDPKPLRPGSSLQSGSFHLSLDPRSGEASASRT